MPVKRSIRSSIRSLDYRVDQRGQQLSTGRTPIKFGEQNVCERLLLVVLLVTTFQSAAIAPKGVHPEQSLEGPIAYRPHPGLPLPLGYATFLEPPVAKQNTLIQDGS
jgi:hypothetical protein